MKKNIYNTVHSKIAIISFVIFLFFAFFGTSLPFQERVRDVDAIGTSNIVNQLVFSLLFLAACISLIPKIYELFILIKKEKFLSFFLIWCLIVILIPLSSPSNKNYKKYYKQYQGKCYIKDLKNSQH